MSPRRINPVVDTFRGINNALNPCSAQYRQFMAFVCKNSRINDSGIWDKAAALENVSSGATQRDIIDDFSLGSTSVDIVSVSAAGGTVTVVTDTHAFEVDDIVTITGTDNYDEKDVTITIVADNTHIAYVSVKTGATSTGVVTNDINLDLHFKEAFINGTQYIVGGLNAKTNIDVGPNKMAYYADPDLLSGAVKWWDGSASGAEKYGLAGLDRPNANTIADIASIATTGTAVTVTTVDDHGFIVGDNVAVANTDNHDIANVEITGKIDKAFTYASTNTGATSTGMAIRGIGVTNNSGGLYGGRMQRGTYYYMYTYFDTARQVESLPSTVTDWVCGQWNPFANVNSGIYSTIMISPDATHTASVGDARIDATTRVRVYRTKRTYEPDRELNSPSKFFYIGDMAYSTTSMSMDDFAHDSELVDMYEGRGTPPPTGVDCLASFENRMYYFVGNVVYWSSSGRPGEVAQEYTLSYETRDPAGGASLSSTFPVLPTLASETQGEAKYEISELAGQTVIGAYPFNGKLWIWTDTMVGYLRPALSVEGVRFHLIRKGLGLISSKTLAHTPYGLFGADREGVWILDNNNSLGRLSEGTIDIDDSTKTTYFKQSTLTLSFGVWVPALSEYWWCAVNTGESTVHRQLAYQPLRRIFGGVYEYTGLTGGCAMITAGGAQSYLTGGKTPSATAIATDMTQQLDFWMGQHSLETVKEDLKVEIIYESITADKSVTVDIYQNQIASTTGAQSDLGALHSDSNLVGKAHGNHSGRMFLVRISTDDNATRCPVIAINYTANQVLWVEKHAR